MTHAGATLRVLTWNVHGCVGRDGVCDPARVARVLEAAQPDICALQEIDARTRAEALDPFSYFGELFGWTTVSARTARSSRYSTVTWHLPSGRRNGRTPERRASPSRWPMRCAV